MLTCQYCYLNMIRCIVYDFQDVPRYLQSVSRKEIENYLANYIIINIKQSIRNRILKVDILKS